MVQAEIHDVPSRPTDEEARGTTPTGRRPVAARPPRHATLGEAHPALAHHAAAACRARAGHHRAAGKREIAVTGGCGGGTILWTMMDHVLYTCVH